MNRRQIILFSAFALLALGAIVYGNYAPRSSGGSTLSEDEDLNGNVRFEEGVFTITNAENKSWDSCWATLNKDYLYPVNAPSRVIGEIGAGDEVHIPSSEFVTESGDRFNVLETRPVSFNLSCDGRFGYWEW